MKRRALVSLVLAAGVLTACGASAPPAKELAIEVVDSMVLRNEITEAEAECMRGKINEYSGDALDDIAQKADGGNTDALASLDQFQADLASCRGAG